MIDTEPLDHSSSDLLVGEAAKELNRIQAQVHALKSTLSRLLQDVALAESRLEANQVADLIEANAQLVLTATRQQETTEAAWSAAHVAARVAAIDGLTQLPTRTVFLDRLNQAIAQVRRNGTLLAVLFIDLDRFKQINDTHGHASGDRALQLVAQCLLAAVRETDTVSRHSGDEFLMLLSPLSHAADATSVATKAVNALNAPRLIGDHLLRLSASIGISVYPQDGNDAAALIDRADKAMYEAKRHGPGSVVSGELEALQPGPRASLSSLRHAVRAQPAIVDEDESRYQLLQHANCALLLSALDSRSLQEAAEEALQRQTRYLGVISHELRNPLAPIQNANTLLGQMASTEPLLSRLHGIIARQLGQLTRLVDDLVDVARVGNDKLHIDRQRVNAIDIFNEVIDACRPAIDARLQLLTISIPSFAIELDADRVRLVQVLHNLLHNASKYTAAKGSISFLAEVRETNLVVTISDDGIGIGADVLPLIFDPFFQAPEAIAHNGTGLGVGLTVVREIVEAHGGQVVAKSRGVGFGSAFEVTLPLASSQASRPLDRGNDQRGSA